jgi:5-methylcytosine-specific restriction endonuclease McrA
MCRAEGYTVAAMVCDHVDPHRGDAMKFWNERNLQSLCFRHHDSDKQRIEKGGRIIGMDGWPVN